MPEVVLLLKCGGLLHRRAIRIDFGCFGLGRLLRFRSGFNHRRFINWRRSMHGIDIFTAVNCPLASHGFEGCGSSPFACDRTSERNIGMTRVAKLVRDIRCWSHDVLHGSKRLLLLDTGEQITDRDRTPFKGAVYHCAGVATDPPIAGNSLPGAYTRIIETGCIPSVAVPRQLSKIAVSTFVYCPP